MSRLARSSPTLQLALALAAGATLLALAACQTAPNAAPVQSATPPAAPMAPPANPATRAAATKGNLALEKLRLAELFKGTPVVFSLLTDGSLRVEVPLEFAFDPGQVVVKPPLAAVLDRIAAGQLHELTKVWIAAPADVQAKGGPIAAERAASVRSYLVGKGLPAARVAVAVIIVTGSVRLVVTEAPPT